MFNSYSNKEVDLFEFVDDMIDIEDIARGLSNECRFAGQCRPFYSVAQHSVLTMELAKDKLQAVMHDCEEGYFKDMPSPLKRHKLMGPYRAACERARGIILVHFGINPIISADVHDADKLAYAIEKANITKRPCSGTDIKLESWEPEYAYHMWLKAFTTLMEDRTWHNVLIPV